MTAADVAHLLIALERLKKEVSKMRKDISALGEQVIEAATKDKGDALPFPKDAADTDR